MALYGPTESRISSKQDHSKAFIEISIKDTTSQDNTDDLRSLDELRSELKSLLEQVIYLSAYPKSILTF